MKFEFDRHFTLFCFATDPNAFDQDVSVCKPCSQCSQNQFVSQTCLGTSFTDEGQCLPCRYVQHCVVKLWCIHELQ